MKKNTFQLPLLGAAVLATLAAATPALAQMQMAGKLSVSLGVTRLEPSVGSGNLTAPSLAGTTATVDANTQLTANVNYALDDNWGLQVPLGMGFKHKVTGTGAIAGAGVIATTRALPITLLAQYRFLAPTSVWRPYVGAGITYAKFYKTNGTAVLTALTNPGGPATTLKFDDKLAPTVQLGVGYNLNERWFVDAAYTKTFLKTRGTLSTGQTLDMRLDPSTYTIGVGYRF